MGKLRGTIRNSSFFLAGLSLVACSPFFEGNLSWRPAPGTHVVQADLRRSVGYYENSVTAINGRHYALALEYLQAARAQKPDDVRVLTAFGVVYDKLGRFDLSARYYAQAASLDPKSRIIAADIDYSRKLQGILTPNAAPMVADAGSSGAGGTPPTVAVSSKTAIPVAAAAPNASGAYPQAAINQFAVNSKDPGGVKVATPAAAKPVPPAGHPSAIVDPAAAASHIAGGTPPPTVAASSKTAVPIAAAAPNANGAHSQAAISEVAVASKDPVVRAKDVVPAVGKLVPMTSHPSAAVDPTAPASNIAGATPSAMVAASSKVAVPVAAAAPKASDTHRQATISQVAVNGKDSIRAKVDAPAAAKLVSPSGHPPVIANASGAGSNIADGTTPRTVAASSKTVVPVAAAPNASYTHRQAVISRVAVNSKDPIRRKVGVPAAAKSVFQSGYSPAIANASAAGSNIVGGTTPRTVAASGKTVVPVAAAPNAGDTHQQAAISRVAANSKDPIRAKAGAPAAAKSLILTGHPLAIVDASGRKGTDKPVRAYLSGRGWSIAKGESLKMGARPQTAILYKETMAVAAKALARTLSLPLPMHLASRNDVEGLQLILGSDISARIIAGKSLQPLHRQLALAIAKPKS